MTDAGATTGAGRRGRGWVRWALLAAVVLGGLALAGRPGEDGPPLDPEATGPLGTRGLVLLLEELGADVRVVDRVPAPGEADVLLVLQDRLDDAGRRAVVRAVDRGATLVVADPLSPLQPFAPAGTTAGALERRCDVPALRDAGEVDLEETGLLDVGGAGGAATACYPDGDGAFLGLVEEGDGVVAALAGARVLTNDSLGDADHAVLAGALLAPSPGTEVAVLRPAAIGGGDRSLVDLLSPGVRGALLQLGIGALVYALWRARRLGPPVPEPQPVPLAASELVVAVGNLLQQAGRRDQAGALLRADLTRTLAERLGLPVDAPAEVVATTAAARTGLPLDRLRAALGPGPVRSDEDLVALSAELSRLGEAVARG